MRFDLAALPCEVTVLQVRDGFHHVLLRKHGRQFQFAVSGADVMQPVQLSTDAIWPMDQLKHRLWALECLNTLCTEGRLPARSFPPEKRGRRLRFVLQALDCSTCGASHREIAIALFGERRVRSDWTDPSDHLRDRIRRAIRRGLFLMNGRYRELLV